MRNLEMKIRKSDLNPTVGGVAIALCRAYDPRPRLIQFVMEGENYAEITVRLTSVEYESAAPGQFNLRGFICRYGKDGRRVRGYYNAIERTGWLRYEE